MSINQIKTESDRPKSQRGGGLAWRMIALLLPLTIIPTLLMGLFVYTRARDLMLQQVSSQMEAFLTEATNQLDSWLLDRSLALTALPRNPEFVDSLGVFLKASPSHADFQNTRNQTLSYLRALNATGQQNIFNDFLIVLPDGEIALSSNRTWESGTLASQDYFREKINNNQKIDFLAVKPGLLYHQDNSPEYQVAIISSVSVLDQQGNLVGYVVGVSESQAIQTVLEANSSFLPNNNLFLLTEEQAFAGVTDLTRTNSLQELTPSESQISLIFSGDSANPQVETLLSYDGTEALGIYQFYNTLNLGFLVEVPAEEVLGTINSLGPTAALVIGLTVLLISALIFGVTRRITVPLTELAEVTEGFAHGNWNSRSTYHGRNEIGSLAASFNRMAEDLSTLYTQMETQVEERTRQVITTSEVSNMATTATGLNELLDRTSDLISERFDYFHIGVYLLDSDKMEGEMRAASGVEARHMLRQGHRILVSRDSIYQQVVRDNELVVVSSQDAAAGLDLDILPEAQSKIAIPISIGQDVIGIIDIQSKDAGAFPKTTSSVLTTLANQLAGAIYNFQLREGAQVGFAQVSQLYLASQRLALADNTEEIFREIVAGVQQTSFFAAVYRPVDAHLELVQSTDNQPYYAEQLPKQLNVSGKLASTFFSSPTPVIIKDLNNAMVPMRPELLYPPRALDAREAGYVPIMINRELQGVIVLASRETNDINLDSLQSFRSLADLVQTKLNKFEIETQNQALLEDLKLQTHFTEQILNETIPDKLYPMIHEQVSQLIGEVDFYVALFDPATERIEIPYLYEGGEPLSIDPFPLGEGLSSIVIRTREPLMLVENTEARAKALGAKIVGETAKSWLGVPLMIGEDVIGILNVQDVSEEYRFTQADLELLVRLSAPIAGAIRSANLLKEAQKRAYQLETSAEIAREASTTLDQDELLSYTLQLVMDRFNFYHASIFLVDAAGEYAVVAESTGEAGTQMKADGHKLAVGSLSIIGNVTANKKPLVVNDVTADPTHRFNPLLPDTRAELGIPIMLGDKVLGALDVQSTTPYDFTSDDIEVLQIFANQLAVAINNAALFAETQENLAQHRLIHHITTVAASASSIEDALSGVVQGLRVTLGDNVSVLLVDKNGETLQVQASSGYDGNVDGMQIPIGQGITGWSAQHNETLVVNDVTEDERYIPGKPEVRSEIALPLTYRNDILGVLNVESETLNAFDDQDQDILGTMAGSLAAVIINARLIERQQSLFDVASRIRQSVNMNTILETTATELTKALQARRARIQVGGDLVQMGEPANGKETKAPGTPEKGGQA